MSLFQNYVEFVRTQFERCQISEELLCSLYMQYNPIPDVGEYMKQATRLFPRFNCGVTTIYLQYVLREGILIRGTYKGNHHTFLEVREKYIIDITADQYGGPSVYVGILKFPWKKRVV